MPAFTCIICNSTNVKRLNHVIIHCMECRNNTNIHDIVGDAPDGYQNPYPNTVWLIVKSPVAIPQIGDDSWTWMATQSRKLGALLVDRHIGWGDGFGGGFGALDVHFLVSDIDRAVQIIFDALTDDELIQFTTIKSFQHHLENVPENWHTHWIPNVVPLDDIEG